MTSKFSGLLRAKQSPVAEPLQSFEPDDQKELSKPPIVEVPVHSQVPKPGRPRAKRSNPDFEQVTAYIRRDTYIQVKMKLLEQGGTRDFSELVELLLSEYLRTQNANNSRV